MLSNVLIKRSLIISVGLLAIIAGYLLAADNRVAEEINVDCVGEVHRAGVGLKYNNYNCVYQIPSTTSVFIFDHSTNLHRILFT